MRSSSARRSAPSQVRHPQGGEAESEVRHPQGGEAESEVRHPQGGEAECPGISFKNI